MSTEDQDRLILRGALPAELGVSSETVRRWMRDGKLPKPDVDLSLRTRGWKLSTLRAAGLGIKSAPIVVPNEQTMPASSQPRKRPRRRAEVPDPIPVPHADGRCSLYRHYDAFGRLLYVGISLSAVERLARHRVESHWVSHIARIEITAYGSRNDAVLAERRAIMRESPAHNILHARKSNKAQA